MFKTYRARLENRQAKRKCKYENFRELALSSIFRQFSRFVRDDSKQANPRVLSRSTTRACVSRPISMVPESARVPREKKILLPTSFSRGVSGHRCFLTRKSPCTLSSHIICTLDVSTHPGSYNTVTSKRLSIFHDLKSRVTDVC